eukprot:TRINITY_DN4268_c0_g1_i10.p1 TRINITY_DN4268_c0_g1~~TRINITY_DN4268_c0_g1_i10.p1  ORF type:complete len:843 (+),score=75.53 TRINITY_DN4268_c0_g1_i10:43-2571(+)
MRRTGLLVALAAAVRPTAGQNGIFDCQRGAAGAVVCGNQVCYDFSNAMDGDFYCLCTQAHINTAVDAQFRAPARCALDECVPGQCSKYLSLGLNGTNAVKGGFPINATLAAPVTYTWCRSWCRVDRQCTGYSWDCGSGCTAGTAQNTTQTGICDIYTVPLVPLDFEAGPPHIKATLRRPRGASGIQGQCAHSDAGVPVCPQPLQECYDPNPSETGDWVCRCTEDSTITRQLDVVTSSCPTPAPPTPHPPTPSPPTMAPPTPHPPTPNPPSVSPPTPMPPTPHPPTPRPPTLDFPTPLPPTPLPPTPLPGMETPWPLTRAPASETLQPTTAPEDMHSPFPGTSLPTLATPNPKTSTQAPLDEESIPPSPAPVATVPQLPEKATATVKDTASAAVVGTALAGGAGPATRLAALTLGCGEAIEYSRVLSPLALVLWGSEALGAVVGNVLLAAAVVLVQALVARMTGLVSAAPVAALQVLYQGTALAAMDLIQRDGVPVVGRAVGVVTVGACVAVPTVILRVIRRGVPEKACVRVDSTTQGRVAEFLLSRGEWVNRRAGSRWVETWSTMLRPYEMATPWFGIADFAASLAVAVAITTQGSTSATCGWGRIMAATVFIVMLCMELCMWPHLAQRNAMFDIMILGAQALSQAVQAVGYLSEWEEAWAFEAAADLLLGAVVVMMVRAVFDVGAFGWVLFTKRRERLQDEESRQSEDAMEVGVLDRGWDDDMTLSQGMNATFVSSVVSGSSATSKALRTSFGNKEDGVLSDQKSSGEGGARPKLFTNTARARLAPGAGTQDRLCGWPQRGEEPHVPPAKRGFTFSNSPAAPSLGCRTRGTTLPSLRKPPF